MCGSKNRNDACQVDAPQLFKLVSHPNTHPPSSFALGYFNHACVYPGRQRAGRQEMLISSMLFWWFPCSCRLDSNPARQRAGRQEAVVIHLALSCAILCVCSEFAASELVVSVLPSSPGRQRAGRQEVYRSPIYVVSPGLPAFLFQAVLSLCLMTLAASELAARKRWLSTFGPCSLCDRARVFRTCRV